MAMKLLEKVVVIINKYFPVVILAILFVYGSMMLYSCWIANSTMQESVFYQQRAIKQSIQVLSGIAILIVGIAFLLSGFITLFIHSLKPYFIYLTATILFGIALFIFIILLSIYQKVQKKKYFFLVLFVIFYNPIILFISFMGTPAVEKPTYCERFISSSNGIRIVSYEEKQLAPGAWYFYLATNDRRKTWQQLMYNHWDYPLKPPCENIKSRNQQHYWVWIDAKAAITTDGGKKWNLWSSEKAKPKILPFINSIEFDNETHGTMLMGYDSDIILHTTDGGKSWK